MRFSHSRVSAFTKCPYKFKLRYLIGVNTIRDSAPDDALIVGNAMHKGIEQGIAAAGQWYSEQFSVLTNLNINEIIKLETLLPKVRKLIDYDKSTFEFEIQTNDFVGYIDLIVKKEDNVVELFDFKHSNHVDRYLESEQLHIYKHYLEKIHPVHVSRMGYIFIPKVSIRQKKTEDLYQFRKRLLETLHEAKVSVCEVTYDQQKVDRFFQNIGQINEANEYPKNPTKLCDWCQYQEYCVKGMDYMLILPKNERVQVDKGTAPVLWLYGVPFSGKTTFANQAPDVIHLNTDGNVKYVDGARIIVRDEIKINGRIKETVFAWQMFKEAVETLCIGQHDFKTIVIDLVEDLLEHCRIYMYDKLGITHEADAGYGKGYDMVRTEFLPQLRRLTNAGYGVILISHEVAAEITKRNGEKVTTIKPNLQDKYASKIAGMVDIVGRVIIDEDDCRWIKFKTDTIQFGGGRLKFGTDKVELDYNKFMELYRTTKPEVGTRPVQPSAAKKEVSAETKDNEAVNVTQSEAERNAGEDKPKRRSRRSA
ncbi:MAG: phage nucleotide-binding protein [Firmicutes bacterium]|nr:phage nucleotide-binding protein [Bacillota bacterium]